MEDETLCQCHRHPDLNGRERLVVTHSKFLIVEGPLQNQDGVIYVKATRLMAFSDGARATFPRFSLSPRHISGDGSDQS